MKQTSPNKTKTFSQPRLWHKIIGWILCVPLVLWAFTGAVFILKPGYGDAYEQLTVSMPASTSAAPISLQLEPHWQEAKWVNTVIGPRLLVTYGNMHQPSKPSLKQHLNAAQQEQPLNLNEAKQLMASATAHNLARYGTIQQLSPAGQHQVVATTTTGVILTLNWQTLRLQQKGRDRRIIDTLYKLHYLQYTPFAWLNKVVATVGLALLIGLTGLGLWLALRKTSR